MDKYLDKVNVPTAVTDKTKMDLGTQHISTADFMQLNVAKIMEVVPNETVNVNMETFARLNPLVVPTLGRASIKTSKFFVPFRTIFPQFNDMMADTIHTYSDGDYSTSKIPNRVPTITNNDLCSLFIGASAASYTEAAMVFAEDASSQAYDIAYVTGYTTGGTAQVLKYSYSNIGRQIFKLLTSLGYSIVWDTSYNDSYSLMPILALMRVYADWYFPTQYTNLSVYQKIMSLLKYDIATAASLNLSDLRAILKLMSFVQYDSSCFVSAWDQPNEPTLGTYSVDYQIRNIDSVKTIYGSALQYTKDNGYVSNNANNANSSNRVGGANAPFISPYVVAGSTSAATGSYATTPISEYMLHSLHALTDFMKRNQLVGTRAYERLLARYGVNTPAEKINRSVFLGSDTQAVQIGDVMSTADTDGAELGKMAGKGISYGQSNLNFSSDEFGYVLILSSIIPQTGYYQGCDPLTLRKTRLEFFVPEFDALGVEPILSKTLYVPSNINDNGWSNLPNQVFGFLPRYYSYKTACHDTLSGNFRCASLNGTNPLFPDVFNGGSAWHLMRTFDATDYTDAAEIVHSADFMLGQNDYDQYKRIFYYVGSDGDKVEIGPDNFTIVYNFDIAAYAPMKSLYDSYEFEDKGKRITMDVSGVKVN